jgi:hypothetical protein
MTNVTINVTIAVAVTLAASALGGCSAGSGSGGLTTGALFGSAQAESVAAAVPDGSVRAAQVGAVSARAAKCGFNFDPASLRSSFLAAETAADPAALGKVEREYDTIRSKVAAAIAKDHEFCSDSKSAEIKSDLTRHMAGDFSPRQAKVIDQALLKAAVPKERETINPDFLVDSRAKKTKSVPM